MSKEVEPGTEAAAIVEAEEQLHARVHGRLALGDDDSDDSVQASELDRDLIELRDAAAEAKPEDLAPLVEQMTRMAALRARVGRSRALPADIQSPYFAHMVLREDGRSRDVLIGKRGFIDRQANVQIVDWRNAPISQIYYRYDEGDDYDEDIGGRAFSGLVEVRRSVSISSSRLRRIGTPQGTFVRDARDVWHEASGSMLPVLQGGAGKAARAPRALGPATGERAGGGKRDRGRLGVHHGPDHRADKHLPEIAALIDKEQFDLITQPRAGLVVIQGGAGSGKTTVALHRVAYLNFLDRQRFAPHKMLVVVPSEALARYVAAVIPSLGVSGVPVLTYEHWARATRQKVLPGTGQQYTRDAPDASVRVKKHWALLGVLEDYVAEQVRETGARLADAVGAQPEGDQVMTRWGQLRDEPLVPRLRALWRSVCGDQGRLPAATRAAAESAVAALGRRADDVVADWADLMTDERRLSEGFARHGAEVSPGEIAAAVSWCASQASVDADGPVVDNDGRAIEAVDGRAVDEDAIAGRFDDQDDPILLRLVQLKRGGLLQKQQSKEVLYEHVAIDEAQDRSAIEIKVLLEAINADGGDHAKRSVTIAGDTAQRLVFDNAFTDWSSLLAHTGHDDITVQPLRLSYRSTAEVMQLAREILGPGLAPDDPLVARHGAPVELHAFGDTGEAVMFLAEAMRALAAREPTASVAVIARHAAQADVYYAGLERAEVASLRRVRDQSFSFTPGVDVTEIAQVKGLEFDYVVLVDVDAATYPETVEARHLLHIGATRAAHQLWMVASGRPSPLVPTDVIIG